MAFPIGPAYATYRPTSSIPGAERCSGFAISHIGQAATIDTRSGGISQPYLNDADVEIDTNSLERALRAIPMGRRNWLFCWTEVGAQQVGVIQSLLVTCKLHDIDPYDYLVDVLQRISE